jgi:pyruvate kinase
MIDIYGTLGPSCNSQDVLREMFCSGMTGIRLNLSHISLRESERQLDIFYTAALHAGVEPLLLIDMQGPELRIGRLQAPLMLCEGQTAVLFDEEMGEDERLSLRRQGGAAIPIPKVVYKALDVGEEILLDDGRLLLRVSEKSSGRVGARIERGGMLSGRKSIKVIGVDIHPPTMTAADRMNIRDAVRFGVTGIMQPFVRSREDLIAVKKELEDKGAGDLQLVAKIENREGMAQLDSLLPVCDAVCIARGDLGNDMQLWELPAAQKKIAAACRASGRYFMVATQMLASMENRAVPTRAEVNDIFNTVADGASGVMVTGETAVGKYPVDVIRFLAATAREGEKYRTICHQNGGSI